MQLGLSKRRACGLCRISRSTFQYQPRARDDSALQARLLALVEKYPRYGCPLLHDMLRGEGLVQNHKRTARLYRSLALAVRRRSRGKVRRPRVPLAAPTAPGQRWSMDFVSDQLTSGRRFRVLNVIDDCTRECLGQLVDVSISGQAVARFLNALLRCYEAPPRIVCDNGTEFTSKAMFEWQKESRVQLHFIQPGKPTQNAFIESFNGKLREACLNQLWFTNLAEARREIEAWRIHYNEERPHSSLKGQPPLLFRLQFEAGRQQEDRLKAEEKKVNPAHKEAAVAA
jgi:putative transposase